MPSSHDTHITHMYVLSLSPRPQELWFLVILVPLEQVIACRNPGHGGGVVFTSWKPGSHGSELLREVTRVHLPSLQHRLDRRSERGQVIPIGIMHIPLISGLFYPYIDNVCNASLTV